jgi:hypothetical protein
LAQINGTLQLAHNKLKENQQKSWKEMYEKELKKYNMLQKEEERREKIEYMSPIKPKQRRNSCQKELHTPRAHHSATPSSLKSVNKMDRLMDSLTKDWHRKSSSARRSMPLQDHNEIVVRY